MVEVVITHEDGIANGVPLVVCVLVCREVILSNLILYPIIAESRAKTLLG